MASTAEARLDDWPAAGGFQLASPESRLDVPSVETTLKYEGYLRRQESEVSKRAREEHCRIPSGFAYAAFLACRRRWSSGFPRRAGDARAGDASAWRDTGGRSPFCPPTSRVMLRRVDPRKACQTRQKSRSNPLQDALSGLAAYFELLKKWNQKVSLTSLPIF